MRRFGGINYSAGFVRITVIALGTRGDVTPCLALARRLQSDGHSLRFATHTDFKSLVSGHGLAFSAVSGSYEAFLATSEGRHALGAPRGALSGLRSVFAPFAACAEQVVAECLDACADAQAIVCSTVADPVAWMIAGARDIPMACVETTPSVPSGRLPHPCFPQWPFGPLYSKLTYALAGRLVLKGASGVFERWQREAARLGAAPSGKTVRAAALVAVSPRVLPRPDDWPDYAHITGYWFLPERADGELPETLRDFLAAGAPPVHFDFAGVPDDEPDRLLSLIRGALARLKLRGIVTLAGHPLSGHVSSGDLFAADGVPRELLLPHVRASVHQGAALSAADSLVGGLPQVVVPYCLDQMFWARRMHRVGVAPPAIPRHKLTAGNLARAIRRALDVPAYRENAAALAEPIRGEDGLGQAAGILRGLLTS